ncbi:MAG: hypothetical protein HY814_06205 [Candidatus Riflebacteria bacterium]|nr:hypothetical protein [Candidatus Riflebacteria bacterium]
MNARTLALLALGFGGLAAAAAAQDYGRSETVEGGYRSSIRQTHDVGGSVGDEWGEPDPVSSRSRASRSSGSRHEFFEDEDPAYSLRTEHVRRQPRYDDESEQRGLRGKVGPDPELARSETARLSAARRQALARGEIGDEVRRVEDEMERLEHRATEDRPAPRMTKRAPVEEPEDAPMRSRRSPSARTSTRKMAPFSDDPDGEKERSSAGFDPRHAVRETSRGEPEGPARSRSARQRPNAGDDELRSEAAPAASNTRNLLVLERQLSSMRRRGAPSEEMEPLETQAKEMRAKWKSANVRETGESPAVSSRFRRSPSRQASRETPRIDLEPEGPAPARRRGPLAKIFGSSDDDSAGAAPVSGRSSGFGGPAHRN